jgi:hypothetical protein
MAGTRRSTSSKAGPGSRKGSGGLSRTPPGRLPRDTPVDTPAVAKARTAPAGALIEPPAALPVLVGAGALASRPETIEAAYEAWDDLREERRALRATFESERTRLEEQGALLLGAVKAASQPTNASPALAKTSALAKMADDARASWEASKAALERRAADSEAALDRATAEVVAELIRRVRAQASSVPPPLELMVRVLPGDHRILHARRPSPDGAVLLLHAMSGRVPTRYGFLFDDSTDDALLAPPTLYADEGLANTRLKPSELVSALTAMDRLWPLKGMLLQLGSDLTVRWLSRGAVLEAEVMDHDGFRNRLTRDEAERITGALLSMKLEGRLELELVRG